MTSAGQKTFLGMAQKIYLIQRCISSREQFSDVKICTPLQGPTHTQATDQIAWDVLLLITLPSPQVKSEEPCMCIFFLNIIPTICSCCTGLPQEQSRFMEIVNICEGGPATCGQRTYIQGAIHSTHRVSQLFSQDYLFPTPDFA